LHRIDRKLNRLLTLGGKLMSANEQVLAFLAKLDTYTSDLAAQQTVQTAKITEIAADIDSLLAAGGADLPPDTVARLEAASAGLSEHIAFETAQAETLTNIAAKNDTPLPAPVKPRSTAPASTRVKQTPPQTVPQAPFTGPRK
jgi:hypothetical protein